MARAAGCLSGRQPAVAPAVGHCKIRDHTGVHTPHHIYFVPLEISSDAHAGSVPPP